MRNVIVSGLGWSRLAQTCWKLRRVSCDITALSIIALSIILEVDMFSGCTLLSFILILVHQCHRLHAGVDCPLSPSGKILAG